MKITGDEEAESTPLKDELGSAGREKGGTQVFPGLMSINYK